ncbi:USP domain-containing protein [Balamuthia mandrillaris]
MSSTTASDGTKRADGGGDGSSSSASSSTSSSVITVDEHETSKETPTQNGGEQRDKEVVVAVEEEEEEGSDKAKRASSSSRQKKTEIFDPTSVEEERKRKNKEQKDEEGDHNGKEEKGETAGRRSKDKAGSAKEERSTSPRARDGDRDRERNAVSRDRSPRSRGYAYMDKADWRRFYSSIERGLKEDFLPLTPLELAQEVVTDAIEGKITDEEQLHYFLTSALHKFVRNLLLRREFSAEAKDNITCFFLAVIDLIIHFIPKDIRELANTLCVLLSPGHPYYKSKTRWAREAASKINADVKRFFEAITVDGPENAMKRDYYRLPKADVITPHYIINLNYFGKRGGFDAIIERVKDKENPTTLGFLEALVRAVGNMSEYLSNEFVKEYIPILKDTVFGFLLSVSRDNNMERNARIRFKDIGKTMKLLLALVMDEDEIDQLVEEFNLNHALMSFQSANLERRLQGLKHIRKMVTRATPKDDKKSITSIMWNKAKAAAASATATVVIGATPGLQDGMADEKKEKEEKPVDPQFLLNWIEENKVIKYLFTNTHEELIKQSVQVLSFMASHGRLTTEQLDMLWEASLGRHESEKRVIFEAIVTLAQKLPLKTIDHIFDRIKETKLKNYDSETLTLVHDFTILGIKANTSGKKNWYGMETLWKLLQDDAKVSLADQAFDHLSELLKMEICAPIRSHYTERCAENLLKKTSVPQSLKLMIKIIETHPKKGRKKALEALDKKHRLMSAFFEDVKEYKELTKGCKVGKNGIVKLKKDSSKSSNHQKPLRPRFTYIEEIKTRLEFLEFVLTNSSISLSAAQVDVLWDCFITNALIPEEREACFAWLEKSRVNKSDGFVAFDESIIQHLFVDKMAQMDCTLLNQAGYNVFQRYFLTINEKKDKLKRVDKSQASEFYVVSGDLIGENNLWKIALDATDVDVSQMAIRLLNQLHQKVSPDSMKSKLGKIREAYIRTCMAHLSEAAKASKSPLQEQRIERCLSLLKNFVEEFELRSKLRSAASPTSPTPGGGSSIGTTVGGGNSGSAIASKKADSGVPITLYVKADLRRSFVAHVRSKDTLLSLKRKISEHYEKPPRLLRLWVNDKEIKDNDSKTLADCKVTDGLDVFVQIKEEQQPRNVSPTGKKAQSESKKSSSEPQDEDDQDDGSYQEIPMDSVLLNVLQMQMRAVGLATQNLDAVLKLNSRLAAPPAKPAKSKTPRTDRKKEEVSGAHHPSQILSSEENFDQLYHLLDFGDKIGEQVWELLNLLPSNKKIVDKLQSIDKDVDWNVLLDRQFIFKLIYTLQVVERLITETPEGSVASGAKRNEAWCNRFVELGGGKYLVDMLMNMDKEEHSQWKSAQRACFAHLLRIINLLAISDDDFQSLEQPRLQQALFDNVKMSDLVDQLLTIIADAAKESNEAAASKTCDSHVIPEEEMEGAEHERRDRESEYVASAAQNNDGTSTTPSITVSPSPSTPALDVEVSSSSSASSSSAADLPSSSSSSNIVAVASTSSSAPSPSSTPKNKPEEVGHEARMVEHALDLLIACLLSDVSLLQHFYGYQHLNEWLLDLLLKTRVKPIRNATASSIYKLCRRVADPEVLKQLPEPPAKFFVQLLLSFLSHVDTLGENTCEQYFNLLRNLLMEKSAELPDEDAKTLLYELIQQIKRAPVRETSSLVASDTILIGLLDTARTLTRKYPFLKSECRSKKGGLLKEVYRKCLYDLPTAENNGPHGPPKCKTLQSRTAAFKLLTELARDCQKCFKELFKLLVRQLDKTENRSWSLMAMRRQRSPYGYVGLQNQGATCYMNSLMQQLYLIPRFRYGILMADDESEDPSESTLYQLQTLFANLEQSVKRAFDTIDFCSAYKDSSGRPVNTAQQMDANEFFNNLFEKLEGHLKGTPQENLLKDVFGGELCNQLIPKGCPHRSEREEPFYTVGIEIKNKKDILESLKLFISGEMLQGENKYKCDICNTGRDTLKRCCISKLPKVLMLHLKRFEFDLNLMRNVKLNDLCEFPMQLNMEPFTKEYLARQEMESANLRMSQDTQRNDFQKRPPSYYQYQLVGIVVHQGNADSGHYYSFIQERVPLGENRDPRWYEFNDTNVLPFDTARIPYETFGGEEEVTIHDREKNTTRIVKRPKSHNAYILVYQRAHTSLVGQASDEENDDDEDKETESEREEAGSSSEEKKKKTAEDHQEEEEEGGKLLPEKTDSFEVLPTAAMTAPKGEEEQCEGHTKQSSDNSLEPSPSLTPSGSFSSLNEVEERSSFSEVESSQQQQKEDEKEKQIEESRFKGGVMATSPSFLAVLFLAKLEAARRRKQKEDERKRREEQKKKFLSGESNCIIPDSIMNAIWEENRQFLMEKYVHDEDYLNFIWDFTNLYASRIAKKSKKDYDPNLKTIQFVTRFMIEIGSRTKHDSESFDSWVYHIKRLYSANLDVCPLSLSLSRLQTYPLKKFSQACRWLLNMLVKDTHRLHEILIQCPIERVRRAFQDIMLHAIKCLLPIEQSHFQFESDRLKAKRVQLKEESKGKSKSRSKTSSRKTQSKDKEQGDDRGDKDKGKGKGKEKENETEEENKFEDKTTEQPSQGDSSSSSSSIVGKEEAERVDYIITFMETLFSFLPQMRSHLRNCAQYFNLIYEFARLGVEEKKYLLSRHIVQKMADWYLQKGKFNPDAHSISPKGRSFSGTGQRARYKPPPSIMSSTRMHAPNLAGMVQLIAHLSCCCAIEVETEQTPPTQLALPDGEEPLRLPKKDRDALLGDTSFIVQLVKEQVHLLSTSDLLRHWCFEDGKRSKSYILALRDELCKTTSHEFHGPFLQILSQFCELVDSLQIWRTETTMVALVRAIEGSGKLNSKESKNSVRKFILSLGERNEHVKSWLSKNKALVGDILELDPIVNPNSSAAGVVHHHHGQGGHHGGGGGGGFIAKTNNILLKYAGGRK